MKIETVLLRVVMVSAVTAIIAGILANVTGTWHPDNIFFWVGAPAVVTTIGSFILFCASTFITAPAAQRKFQAEVDEHKKNLAKGGAVAPVRAAVK